MALAALHGEDGGGKFASSQLEVFREEEVSAEWEVISDQWKSEDSGGKLGGLEDARLEESPTKEAELRGHLRDADE